MRINIKKMRDNAIIPTRGSQYAAGYDLYACETMDVWPGESVLFHSGIAMEIPRGYFGAVYSRSGLSTKKHLVLSNATGIIDCDFRNEIGIPIRNHGSEKQTIHAGDRIAQIIIQPYQDIDFYEQDELSETERGMNGFGSTGVR